MAGFAFNFSSDDIEEDEPDEGTREREVLYRDALVSHDLSPVRLHTLSDMLSTLPSALSYSVHTVSTEPLICLPRRELFDIRAQLLAEIDGKDTRSTALVEGLTSDDIRPRLYEGGFKTWECSLDLARLLVSEILQCSEEAWTNIVEIGAGTAVPSCAVLNALLKRYPPDSSTTISNTRQRTLIVADYNEHVLTHASIPNLLLTFAYALNSGNIFSEDGDLDITGKLLDHFQTWLNGIGLRILGVSGAWSPKFNEVVEQTLDQRQRLILASETIYQPESLTAFTAVFSKLLRANRGAESTDMALIASKKIYFGVGGGIDEFLSALSATSCQTSSVWSSGAVGVSRVILRVVQPHGKP